MPEEQLENLKIAKTEKMAMPAKRKKKRIVTVVILLAALAATGLYFSGVIAPAVSVDVTTISPMYPAQSLSVLNASGYIVAQRKAAVSSKVTGRLEALMVEEGSKVKKGQVIARLENEDVKASRAQIAANINTSRAMLEQARAEKDDAKRDYDRFKRLVAGGFIAQAQYDAAEARYLRALAAVDAAEATVKAGGAALQGADTAIGYTSIVAPFDAVVLTKNADVGDIVTPIGAAANAKSAVVTIADMDSLQVEVDVSETGISAIKAGQPCVIQLDAIPDKNFRGEVHAIVPTVDRSKATVMVKVRFLDKDPRMLPDMSAKVAFLSRPIKPEEQKARLAVNQDAVIAQNGRTIVFLVEKDRIREIPVKVGAKLGDMIEIIEGLKQGDKAVLKPPKHLKNGIKIKINEK